MTAAPQNPFAVPTTTPGVYVPAEDTTGGFFVNKAMWDQLMSALHQHGIMDANTTIDAPHPDMRMRSLYAKQVVIDDAIWIVNNPLGIAMPLGSSAITDAYQLRWLENDPPSTSGDEVYIYGSRASGDPYLYLYCREDSGDGFARVEIGDLTSSGYIGLLAAGGGDLSELVVTPTTLQWGPVGASFDVALLGDWSELTIASGAVTMTSGAHTIETEGGSGTDDLDTINGGTSAQVLIISASTSAHTVVAKDGTGNLKLEGDCTLDNAEDTLTLVKKGSNWVEIARSNNGA